MLSDLMDGGPQMFDYQEGEFTLDPNENVDLSFSMNNNEISSTTISLSVWPIHHGYAIKELMFSVLPSASLLGDINQDDMFNVLDVVLMVNIILGLSDSVDNGDINGDNAIDILDVVLLVNFVLGGDTPSSAEFSAADLNNDNILNILDVVMLTNLILGS